MQAFLTTLPTPDEYAQLIQVHRNALANIGVNYLDFFQPHYATREDGVHPNKKAMAYALALIKNRINNCLTNEQRIEYRTKAIEIKDDNCPSFQMSDQVFKLP
ncbi:MAG: hypothetical protein PHY54_05360 [Methylococcales bacterium]|nr:hypothetical protein [Methylococcales bacterium]